MSEVSKFYKENFFIKTLIFTSIFLVVCASLVNGYYTVGMKNISQTIYSGKANVGWVGDSLSSSEATPRMIYGQIRTWKPLNWKGVICRVGGGGIADGCQSYLPAARYRDIEAGNMTLGGHSKHHLVSLIEANFSEDSIPQAYYRAGVSTADYDLFPNDWTNNHPLSFRWIYVSSNQTRNYTLQTIMRGDWDYTSYTQYTFNETPYGIYFKEINRTASLPTAANLTELRIITNQNMTDSLLYPYSVRIYRSDLSTGLELSAVSNGGWNTWMHYKGGNVSSCVTADCSYMRNYSDDSVARWINATDLNIFMIMLGTNVAPDEWDGSSTGNYEENIIKVTEKWVRNYYVAKPLGPKPMIVYVSSWDTSQGDGNALGRERDMENITRTGGNDNLRANATLGMIKLRQYINDTNGTYNNWQGLYLSDGIHENTNGSINFARLMWFAINSSFNPVTGQINDFNFTVESATFKNTTLLSNVDAGLFNNTDVYNQTLNLTNLNNALVYDRLGIARCLNVSSCDNFIDLNVSNGSVVYVFNNYNLTEERSVNASPIRFSFTNLTAKNITSNLTSTVNITVVFNVSSCDNVTTIVYTSHTGIYNFTRAEGEYTCANSQVYLYDVPIESANQSNHFDVNYEEAANSGSSSTGSSGGGGGGLSEFWINTYSVSYEQFLLSHNRILGQRERIKLNISGETHHIGIINISNSWVIINLSSTPQQARFSIGDLKKFEVTGDGYYDVSVKLNSISDNKANLTVGYVYERIVVAESGENATVNQTYTEEEVQSGKTNSRIFIPIVVIAFLVAYILIKKISSLKRPARPPRHPERHYRKKNRKKKNHKK